MDTVSRRQALRLFTGAIGSAAVAGVTVGFSQPATAAAAAPVITATLDKSRYEAGELMTLVVTEDIVKPDRRTIKVIDSTGTIWTKVRDNGRTPTYTARAGENRLGENTVTAAVRRTSDGTTVFASAAYVLGDQWRPRFVGDRRDQVMLGMAVTDKANSNLRWEHAASLLGPAAAALAVRRCFVPAWISRANIDGWADWAETNGVYPVISFKVPGNDWAGVAAGKYDADLAVLITRLQERATAGRAPVCVAVHHEPAGDGSLAVWARMQEYLSNHFAAYNDVFCFTTISNGYDWGPHRGGTGEVELAYPRTLIDALNRNKHILACDTYDSADSTKLDYNQYDRTSLKIEGFVAWARAQGVERIGLGEFGCHDDVDIERCWGIISANRDIFAYACHFNSGQNSRADWRMTPIGYPADPAVNSYVDRGGSVASSLRLAAGQRMFTASTASVKARR